MTIDAPLARVVLFHVDLREGCTARGIHCVASAAEGSRLIDHKLGAIEIFGVGGARAVACFARDSLIGMRSVDAVTVDARLFPFKLLLMARDHRERTVAIVPSLTERIWNYDGSQPGECKNQTAKHDTNPRRLWCHNVSLFSTSSPHVNNGDLTSLINCESAGHSPNSHGFYVIGITDMEFAVDLGV